MNDKPWAWLMYIGSANVVMETRALYLPVPPLLKQNGGNDTARRTRLAPRVRARRTCLYLMAWRRLRLMNGI